MHLDSFGTDASQLDANSVAFAWAFEGPLSIVEIAVLPADLTFIAP